MPVKTSPPSEAELIELENALLQVTPSKAERAIGKTLDCSKCDLCWRCESRMQGSLGHDGEWDGSQDADRLKTTLRRLIDLARESR